MNLSSYPLAAMPEVPTSHWDGTLAVDLFAPDLTPVLAVFDGWAESYTAPAGGNAVTLTADDGTAAYYAHLAYPGASGRVEAGQVIGYEGHTGNADKGGGPSDSHLHFALASSPDVLAARNGSGDIAPWSALLGSSLGPQPPAAGPGDPWGILGPIGLPLPPGVTGGTLPNQPGAAAAGGVNWGPLLVLGGLVLVALTILDD